ncbi:unnamed protein product [Linum trigynum]|uniref:Uncharacterized protein n=1 Tax=Linum trigynum TaxID=586398 RepID=A0AAV2DJQ5_9ROSI
MVVVPNDSGTLPLRSGHYHLVVSLATTRCQWYATRGKGEFVTSHRDLVAVVVGGRGRGSTVGGMAMQRWWEGGERATTVVGGGGHDEVVGGLRRGAVAMRWWEAEGTTGRREEEEDEEEERMVGDGGI